jgi:hypothetical protein
MAKPNDQPSKVSADHLGNLSSDSSDRGKLVRANLVGMARICRKGEGFCLLLEKTEQTAPNFGVGGLVKILQLQSEGRIVPTTVTRNGAGPPFGCQGPLHVMEPAPPARAGQSSNQANWSDARYM